MESQQKIQIGALLRRFFMFTEPHRDATFFYNLNAEPPHLVAKHRGATYLIEQGGNTWYCLGEVVRVPAPGNPFPRELATLQAALTFRRVVPFLPWVALVVAALTVMQFMLWNIPDAPTDEMRLNFISWFSSLMNTVLVTGLCLCSITLLIWNFGKGVRVNLNPLDASPMLLESGQPAPSIYPDTFLMSESPDEQPDNFLRRWTDAEGVQVSGQWIVVITFRRPEAVIVTGTDEGYKFVRDCPDYQGRDWPVEERIVPPGTRFEKETWEQYLQYCHTFAQHYPEWAKVEKINSQDPIKSMKDAMRAEVKNAEA